MKEEDLRQEAYKECKKSQRKETIIVFAIIAVAGTLSGCAFIPVYFLVGLWIRSFPHRAGLLLCPCHLEEASN